MVIDIHSHFMPTEVVEYFRSGEGPATIAVEDRSGEAPLVVQSNGLRYPVFPMFHDPVAKLERMDRDGIDVAVVSILPTLFLFDLEPEETLSVHRVVNDAAARYAAAGDGRLAAMATVPLNAPALAAQELRRAHDELGLRAVEIGTSVGATMLDAPDLEPFWTAAEELGVPVMLHPYLSMIADSPPELDDFHLANVIGNPLETFVAASRLIVGGVFDRHPRLRIQLVHGGGSFPYQLGRLDHAYDTREETRALAQRRPKSYLDHFLFDTVIFDEHALRFLLALAGGERVLYGTDIPFDMADESAREMVERVAPEDAERILGGNAIRIYDLGNGR